MVSNGDDVGDGAAPRLHYGWVVLVLCTLTVFASLGLGRFGYTSLLPPMQAGLGMNNAVAGMLATANLTGYLLLCVAGGALASRFGPRAVITAGLLLVGSSMLLTGIARNVGEVAAWRAVTGIGGGASNVPAMGMLAAWFASRRRGLAAGVGVAGSSFALIVVGPAVPAILSRLGPEGWRACWFLFGAVTLVLAAATGLFMRNRPAELGLRPLGGGAGTTPQQQTAPGRARWRDVYRAGAVWKLGLVYVAFGFSYIIYLTFFTKRLIFDGGYTPQAAGELFMVLGWCSLVCGLLWGSVSDWIGRKGALVIVYLLHTAAFAIFALWPARTGFTVSAVLFGLSAWSIPAIMAATCGDVLGPRLAPAALGFITLFFGLGQAAGPAVAGALADRYDSFVPAYLLAAAVALAGAAGAAALPRTGPVRG